MLTDRYCGNCGGVAREWTWKVQVLRIYYIHDCHQFRTRCRNSIHILVTISINIAIASGLRYILCKSKRWLKRELKGSSMGKMWKLLFNTRTLDTVIFKYE